MIMKPFNKFLVLILVVTLAASAGIPIVSSARPIDPHSFSTSTPGDSLHLRPYSVQPSKDALKWANKQLKKMSLDEKIGQLISVGVNATFLNQDSDAFRLLRHQVVDNHVGGIILFRGPVYESAMLVNRMQKLAHLPLLISSDLEAGSGMRFDDTI